MGQLDPTQAAGEVSGRKTAPGIRRKQDGRNINDTERLVSVVGGGALAAYGLNRRGVSGAMLAIAGAALVRRGASGHCDVYATLGVNTADGNIHLKKQHGPAAVLDASKAIRVQHSVTVNRPRAELYRFWRDFENLPRIMRHLRSVEILDGRRSRWTARAPGGTTVEWVAVVNNEIANELIAWKSAESATVPNAGSVHFRDSLDGRGTEIRVLLEYDPPAGKLGSLIAKLFGEEPDQQVREDLQRFKTLMESGGFPTTAD